MIFSDSGAGPALPRRDAKGLTGGVTGGELGSCDCAKGAVNDRAEDRVEVGDGVAEDEARVVTSL